MKLSSLVQCFPASPYSALVSSETVCSFLSSDTCSLIPEVKTALRWLLPEPGGSSVQQKHSRHPGCAVGLSGALHLGRRHIPLCSHCKVWKRPTAADLVLKCSVIRHPILLLNWERREVRTLALSWCPVTRSAVWWCSGQSYCQPVPGTREEAGALCCSSLPASLIFPDPSSPRWYLSVFCRDLST